MYAKDNCYLYSSVQLYLHFLKGGGGGGLVFTPDFFVKLVFGPLLAQSCQIRSVNMPKTQILGTLLNIVKELRQNIINKKIKIYLIFKLLTVSNNNQ